jgi:Raf kinase inhibitor-like YbhB/YbcL family protein
LQRGENIKMLKQIILSILKDVHAGEKHLLWNEPAVASAPDTIKLTSGDFNDGAPIATRFAGAGVGENISPSLSWQGAPAGTVEYLLVFEDPEAPWPRPFVHMVAAGIAGDITRVDTGILSSDPASLGITLGTGTLGRPGYQGPRAPKGLGVHRYIFQIYALNKKLALSGPPKLSELVGQLNGAVLAKGKLTGTFEQKP